MFARVHPVHPRHVSEVPRVPHCSRAPMSRNQALCPRAPSVPYAVVKRGFANNNNNEDHPHSFKDSSYRAYLPIESYKTMTEEENAKITFKKIDIGALYENCPLKKMSIIATLGRQLSKSGDGESITINPSSGGTVYHELFYHKLPIGLFFEALRKIGPSIDINHKNSSQKSALYYALTHCVDSDFVMSILKTLKARGANFDYSDFKYQCPLSEIAFLEIPLEDRLARLSALMKVYDVDVNKLNTLHKTPLETILIGLRNSDDLTTLVELMLHNNVEVQKSHVNCVSRQLHPALWNMLASRYNKE